MFRRTRIPQTMPRICLISRPLVEPYVRSHLHYPVPHTGDSKRSHFAVGLGDVDTAHRLRSVGFGTQFFSKFLKKCLHASFNLLNILDAHSIHPRCPSIRLYTSPRRFKHILAIDPIVQIQMNTWDHGNRLRYVKAYKITGRDQVQVHFS
jgi:hypothetical protein